MPRRLVPANHRPTQRRPTFGSTDARGSNGGQTRRSEAPMNQPTLFRSQVQRNPRRIRKNATRAIALNSGERRVRKGRIPGESSPRNEVKNPRALRNIRWTVVAPLPIASELGGRGSFQKLQPPGRGSA